MFKCIVADPPWAERGGGQIKRGADRHYPLLSTPQIVEVMRYEPLWLPDKTGCLLWLWTTSNFLQDGFTVMDELGFSYITHLVWVKDKLGLGQRTRQRHEHLLLGRMGTVPIPDPPNRPDSVIDEAEAYAEAFGGTLREAKERHSKKPEEAYRRIERSCSGPRLEMFAREPRAGWFVMGNEIISGA